MFSRSLFFAAALATFAPLVAAHGSIKFAKIDGVMYPAPDPNGDNGEYAIRAVNNINPVKGTGNPAMNCGHNAKVAALVADASPGSKIEFAWRNGLGGTWVHDTGPVMTYMASCGDTGCKNFDTANAQFFKIGELGRRGDDNHWAIKELTAGPDATLSVDLPTDLPAGEYLIRHELIAMQLGMSPGGAEFYPACMQIRLAAPSRSAAPLPSGNQVVTFPGGYSDEDPGIHDQNIYNPGHNYVFPGPPLVSSTVPDPNAPAPPEPSASSSSAGSETPTSSTAAAPAPTPTTGCGNPNKKKVKRVIKRIVRRGPVISNSPLVKREREAVVAVAARHADNVVRSRVMRGVF